MRITVVGSHAAGKTTLVEDFVAAFPGYGHEPEPYWELLDRGTAFSDPPDRDDFMALAGFGIERITERADERDVIFDRCPLDYLAYVEALAPAGADDDVPDGLREDAVEAIRTLDLIVFLPLSNPDEIEGRPDYPRLRLRADRRLKQILRQDEWQIFAGGPALIELRGSPARRLAGLRRAIGG